MMFAATPTKVLLAEDESLVGDMIQEELEISPLMQVVGRASNGLQAIELCRTLRPDVVLMDIAMPQMDGLSAAAAIQSECPTPVVILSAHESATDVQRASEAGVGAYLVKPPKVAELERAIAIAIARHADLMELRRLTTQLQAALAEVKTLSGLLPICSGCKKIRDEKGHWNEVEIYVRQHTQADFTHSLCPHCAEKYYPGYSAHVARRAEKQTQS